MNNAAFFGTGVIAGALNAVARGAVSLPHAVVMMLGATVGSYLSGTFSKHVPQQALRMGVIVFGTFLTVYYFVSNQ